MKIQILILSMLLSLGVNLSAQVLPPETRKFKFYQKKKILKPSNKKFKVKIQNTYSRGKKFKPNDSTFTILCERNDLTIIEAEYKKKKMSIHAYFSLDHIPFQKGSFIIPYAYKDLFTNVETHGKTKVINHNWENFRTNNLPSGQLYDHINGYTRDTLKAISCNFWSRNIRQKLKEHQLPDNYTDGFYHDKTNNIYYLWDDNHGYISKDNCKNWFQTDYPETMIDSLWKSGYRWGGRYKSNYFKGEKFNVKLVKVKKSFDTKKLIKVEQPSNREEVFLTISNAWYAQLSVYENIWCISRQGSMMISKDEGKTWMYYIGNNYNVDIFEIIDGKYLFDGLRLYWIP